MRYGAVPMSDGVSVVKREPRAWSIVRREPKQCSGSDGVNGCMLPSTMLSGFGSLDAHAQQVKELKTPEEAQHGQHRCNGIYETLSGN